MPDSSLSDAIKEAYASAPADIVILHTLELRHPTFVDDLGAPTSIWVVRDHADLTARLEASAPVNGGEIVTFIALSFDLDLPPVDTVPVPEISITLDNVDRAIIEALDGAATSQDKIEVTYRPYLSTDLDGPQMDPPLTLVLTEAHADVMTVTARARMMDIGSKAFPAESYTATRFPGLTR
ncbi:MAG: DUF1833 family protein [Magnetococcales bacterium]|nr:DUF1833 family protein [Magnetococcales bacterium]